MGEGGQPFVPFAVPTVEQVDIDAVVAALRGGWLTRGPGVAHFEEAFAQTVQNRFALATSSCTAALHLALHATDVGPGDEVIVSCLTFVSAANVVLHRGARPVFVDVQDDTLNPDPDAIARAVTASTKAILPVDYAGHPCDLDAILAVAKRIPVIEDAAHSVGAVYKRRPVGSIAPLTCFSFYPTKNMTTAEGGMVTTGDEALDQRMRRLSLHGMDRGAWARYGPAGSAFYQVDEAGYKYNMTDVQAALGLAQLPRLAAWNARRAAIAAQYTAGFADLDTVRTPTTRPDVVHAWHLYPIRLRLDRLTCGRDEILRDLRAAGIGTSVHFIPVHTQPLYSRLLGTGFGLCPRGEQAFRELISLPMYATLTDAQVGRVIDVVHSTLQRHRR